MRESRPETWECAGRILSIAGRPLVMGILNVTPDSFSDGGMHADAGSAVEHGRKMLRDGADIIDVGGESSRPGAEPVSAEEEMRRIIPVIRALAADGATISVDTYKSRVAREAIAAGATIINDITAMTGDPQMAEVAAESKAGVVLMHMQGTPRTMQIAPAYTDVVDEVATWLEQRIKYAVERGIRAEAIALDPGIGFGKTVEHNLSLLAGLRRFAAIGRPVVIGVSRKSFLGRLTGQPVERRTAASVAAAVMAIANGADILRVHDVEETRDAVRVATAIISAGEGEGGIPAGGHH